LSLGACLVWRYQTFRNLSMELTMSSAPTLPSRLLVPRNSHHGTTCSPHSGLQGNT
jgi:hypothetical protein